MHKVLVLDANQRSALAIIRSLGHLGLTVIAADHRKDALGAASKYASASVRYPDPAMLPGTFVSEIRNLIDHLAIDTVIPATDLTTMLLVSQPDLFQFARLAAPTAASYEALTDKATLLELAARLDIPIPVTRIAKTAGGVVNASHDIGFPVVLKPARSRYLKGNRVLSTSVHIVGGPAALHDVLSRQEWLNDIPCLVQRFVPGHGAGIFALYGPSGPIAWFAHRRIREKPPTGGVSVLCESVPVDPLMQSFASRLLFAADWTGVAMIEFKVADDGTPYLMEVNGRFWGSLQLAIDSGVDFPRLSFQVSQSLPVEPPRSYAVGTRLRWLLGDLDSLLIQLRDRGTPLRARAKALSEFARSFADPHCRQEILRISDPRPGIREFALWLNALRST
ncbi:MAG: ATP-dependent carboxylate-amine ligase [Proteobacteria bacterium]|nr:ATP-dependent carboxylate-amine ligase [Pseudomonadota bacterium]